MESKTENRRPFWTTVPGILTALAGVITAVAGLVGVIQPWSGDDARADTTSTTQAGVTTSSSVVPATTAPATLAPTPTVAPTTAPTTAPPTTAPPTTAPPPTITPATPPTRSPVEAILRADPSSGSAGCPVTVEFRGRISLLSGSGTVAYRFLRSDGANAPVQSVTFAGPGSQDVTDSWQLGAAGAQVSGWEQIEVVSPVPATSARATFTIACA